MIRFLRIMGIVVVIGLIARLLLGNDVLYFTAFPVLSKLILLVVLIYVLNVIIKSTRKNSLPASGITWFYRVVGAIALLFFFRQFFGLMSVGFFVFIDNLLEVSRSIPPTVMWALVGLLIGLIYGSVVAWRKYRLHFTITLLPISIFLLVIFILFMVNEPLGFNTIEKITPVDEAGISSNLSASAKKYIVNRWQVVDVLGKSRKDLTKKDFENAELEFKKNGRCYVTEGGVRKLALYYTLSPDGKYLLFSNPDNSLESRQMQIISITRNELIIKSELFQNDTAVLRAK